MRVLHICKCSIRVEARIYVDIKCKQSRLMLTISILVPCVHDCSVFSKLKTCQFQVSFRIDLLCRAYSSLTCPIHDFCTTHRETANHCPVMIPVQQVQPVRNKHERGGPPVGNASGLPASEQSWCKFILILLSFTVQNGTVLKHVMALMVSYISFYDYYGYYGVPLNHDL